MSALAVGDPNHGCQAITNSALQVLPLLAEKDVEGGMGI